jgi:hypothetical protein
MGNGFRVSHFRSLRGVVAIGDENGQLGKWRRIPGMFLLAMRPFRPRLACPGDEEGWTANCRPGEERKGVFDKVFSCPTDSPTPTLRMPGRVGSSE